MGKAVRKVLLPGLDVLTKHAWEGYQAPQPPYGETPSSAANTASFHSPQEQFLVLLTPVHFAQLWLVWLGSM